MLLIRWSGLIAIAAAAYILFTSLAQASQNAVVCLKDGRSCTTKQNADSIQCQRLLDRVEHYRLEDPPRLGLDSPLEFCLDPDGSETTACEDAIDLKCPWRVRP